VYRIEIDRSLCSAYGTCIDLAPDLFELADDLIAVARVGETDAEAAAEAASACPMGAIRLVEIRGDEMTRAA
jgi:ferredoxin